MIRATMLTWCLLIVGVAGCTGVQAQADKAATPEKAPAAAGSKVPDVYHVKFETSAGDFVVEVNKKWAPLGAERMHELVTAKFFDDTKFFRVVPGFMVQFGINGDPKVQEKWRDARIRDDKPTQSNSKGMVTFATSGPNSRTSQIFINYGENSFLDGQGFAPFGRVISGMDVVEKINSQYGESPNQTQIQSRGNAYLNERFPKLDGVKKATIVDGAK